MSFAPSWLGFALATSNGRDWKRDRLDNPFGLDSMARQEPVRLGPSQAKKLRQLVEEVKRLRHSTFLDDLEQQWAYALDVRDVIVQLQALAPPLLHRDLASRLEALDVYEVNDSSSAFTAMATIKAVIPAIEDALAVNGAPDWTNQIDDDELRDLLLELYGALNADYRVLAAIGARTAFDRAFVLKGADPDDNFKKKRAGLKGRGVISDEEDQSLTTLIEAGHAAAHRAWKPDSRTLLTLVKGLEAFLYRTLVQPPEVNAIGVAVPRRAQRQKETQDS